jgi:VIT1/CCC1 family predicted Fe2+/Mn2+ transporter
MVNVGSADRVLRFILGAALAVAPFLLVDSFAPLGVWRYAVVAVGVVLLATAIFRICPAYLLFGVRTCPANRA